ncbi:acetyl-CoA transporter, putative, partial [Plasmodium relictum]
FCTKDCNYSKGKIQKKKNDFHNVVFLLLLYTIQGVPIGVSSIIPLIIQDKVSYSQLSIFSLVSLPFSLKLLWAPIVDSVYNKKIGRRKSWIIPLQLICSFSMIYFGSYVNKWLGEGSNNINLYFLTTFFFVLFFLMATQDIAVDGWALTMLSEENKCLASTCNILGQNIGYCMSQLSFLTLNNKKICFYIFKKYIRFMHLIFYNSHYYRNLYEKVDFIYPSFQPFVDTNLFLKIWGIFILILTIFTCFKIEGSYETNIKRVGEMENCGNQINNEEFENAKETYKKLYELFFLPPMRIIIILFLISRLPFASVEVATNFKMLKRGITKEEFAIFNPFYIPIYILSPAIIGKIIKKIKPLDFYYFGYILRYFSSIILSSLLPITHYMYLNKSKLSHMNFYVYYLYIFFAQIFNHFCIDVMNISSMSFQNLISDPKIGGTYMTFLNTISNIGSHWSSIFLWLLDYTDRKFCYKGKCIFIDGFYIQMIFSFLIGIIISNFILRCIRKLQKNGELIAQIEK